MRVARWDDTKMHHSRGIKAGVFVGWESFYGLIICESKKVNALFARGKGGVFIGESYKLE